MGCDVLGTDLSNPSARAEMNAADLVQIKDDVTGATDQTTVNDFLSNEKYDKYGSPDERLKILQGGTWKNAQGTPYKSSLPIASGFERYRNQLKVAYEVRALKEFVREFVDGAVPAKETTANSQPAAAPADSAPIRVGEREIRKGDEVQYTVGRDSDTHEEVLNKGIVTGRVSESGLIEVRYFVRYSKTSIEYPRGGDWVSDWVAPEELRDPPN